MKNNINKKAIGTFFENKGADFLKDNKIQIISKNFQGSHGEIDLIGYDEDILVFFEVKYRKNLSFGSPQEAINFRKKNKIYITAQEFIFKNKLSDKKIRFDAILFLDENIEWIKNIFWGDEIGKY